MNENWFSKQIDEITVNENKEKASDASIERVRKISKMYIYQNVDKYYPLPLVKHKED